MDVLIVILLLGRSYAPSSRGLVEVDNASYAEGATDVLLRALLLTYLYACCASHFLCPCLVPYNQDDNVLKRSPACAPKVCPFFCFCWVELISVYTDSHFLFVCSTVASFG